MHHEPRTGRTGVGWSRARDPSSPSSPGAPARRIVFGRNLPAGGIDLFTISPDGSQETRLTDDAGYTNIEPEWSPDGSRLIFLSDRGSRHVFDVHTIRGDGSDRRSSDSLQRSIGEQRELVS